MTPEPGGGTGEGGEGEGEIVETKGGGERGERVERKEEKRRRSRRRTRRRKGEKKMRKRSRKKRMRRKRRRSRRTRKRRRRMYQTSLQLPDHQQELVQGVWLQQDAVLKPVSSWLLQLQKTFDRCGNVASVFHSFAFTCQNVPPQNSFPCFRRIC